MENLRVRVQAAIDQGTTARVTQTSGVLSLPLGGRRFVKLGNESGDLTEAGRFYYERIGHAPPEHGMRFDQEPTRRGDTEYIQVGGRQRAHFEAGRGMVLYSPWDAVLLQKNTSNWCSASQCASWESANTDVRTNGSIGSRTGLTAARSGTDLALPLPSVPRRQDLRRGPARPDAAQPRLQGSGTNSPAATS